MSEWGASGCRLGLPPLPRRTSNEGRALSRSRSDQSSAISSARRRPVWTRVSRTSRSRSARPARRRGGFAAAVSSRSNSVSVSQSASCCGFGGPWSSTNGSGRPLRRLSQLQEAAQESEAAVVGRGRRTGALLVGGEVVDDRRFLEDAASVLHAPVEEIVDRNPVGGQGARAATCRLQSPQPVVTGLEKVDRGRHRPGRVAAELRQHVDETRERIDRLGRQLLRWFEPECLGLRALLGWVWPARWLAVLRVGVELEERELTG